MMKVVGKLPQVFRALEFLEDTFSATCSQEPGTEGPQTKLHFTFFIKFYTVNP